VTFPLALFLRKNARHLVEMLGVSLLVNLLALAMPMFSMLVYDKAMGNELHDTLWALSIGMLLLLGQEFGLRIARVHLIEHAAARWDSHLDDRLMRGVLSAPLSRAIPVADLLARYRELSSTREVLSAQFLLPLADLPFFLVFALVVALVGGPMVLIPLAAGALLMALSAACQAVAMNRQRVANAAHRAKLTTLVDVLAARESLLGQPLARAAAAQFGSQSQIGARASARARWWTQLNQQAVPVTMSLASVGMLVAGVLRVEDQAMSVGAVISVNMIGSRMLGMLCGAAPLLARWREFSRALAGLGESVDLKAPPMPDAPGEVQALREEGIRLDNVSFKYAEPQRAVIDGIGLHLRCGEVVALVGASGAGKSTLLRLLAGQVPASGGRLVFGGHRIETEDDRHWLNHHVVHKTQDPCFLGGLLRDIVCGGEPGARDDAIVAALRAAGLGTALDRGDLALNTPVGTNGTGLSGGQRQMLALAAAFHSRRSLLLLDEPTLGLDRVAQERVLEALKPLATGRCVIVATHAAEVIARADRVLVLDRGRVVADGPPSRLMPSSAAPAAAPAPVAAAPLQVPA